MKPVSIIRLIVSVTLVLAGCAFGLILLFGLVNTTSGQNALTAFKLGFFFFSLFILGVTYIINKSRLTTTPEHTMLIIAIFVFSVGVATTATSIKNNYDTVQYIDEINNIPQMQAQQEYDNQYAQILNDRIKTLQSENTLLAAETKKIEEKINNREPIVVETIIRLPAETIYVQEPLVQEEREYNNEYEEEDDD